MVCYGLSVFGNSIVRLVMVTGVSSVSSKWGGAHQARHYMDPPLVTEELIFSVFSPDYSQFHTHLIIPKIIPE